MAPRAAAGGPALAQCRGCSQVLGWSVAAPGERFGGDGLVTLVAREGAVEGRGGSLWCCGCGATVGQLGAAGEARVRPSEVRLVEAPWSCPCCGHGAAAVTAGAAGAAAAAPAAPVPSSAALRAMVEEAVSARLAGSARAQPPGPDAVSFEEIDKIKYVLLALNERVAQLMSVLVPDAAEAPAPPGSKRARKDATGAGPAHAPAPGPAAGGPNVLKSESGGQPQPGSPRRIHVVNARPPTPSSPSSSGMLTAASVAAAAPAAAHAAEPRRRSLAAKGPAHATRSPARAAAKGKEPPPRSPAKTAREGEPAKRPARQTTQRALQAAVVTRPSPRRRSAAPEARVASPCPRRRLPRLAMREKGARECLWCKSEDGKSESERL